MLVLQSLRSSTVPVAGVNRWQACTRQGLNPFDSGHVTGFRQKISPLLVMGLTRNWFQGGHQAFRSLSGRRNVSAIIPCPGAICRRLCRDRSGREIESVPERVRLSEHPRRAAACLPSIRGKRRLRWRHRSHRRQHRHGPARRRYRHHQLPKSVNHPASEQPPFWPGRPWPHRKVRFRMHPADHSTPAYGRF